MPLIKVQAPITVKDIIISENTACLITIKRSAKRVFDLFWNNPNKTAQEVCDMFGTDAVKAFEAHGKLQELILLLDETYSPLIPSKAYIKNLDGTVTISEE